MRFGDVLPNKGDLMCRHHITVVLFILATALTAGAGAARATYSIVACDAKTRECGVAVQTNNLAVGASVPYAQAGVGALVSQFETNPHYGPLGLGLLAQGVSPEETLKRLLAEDDNFDGEGPEARQVGLVSVDGRAANFTGDDAQRSDWAGTRSGAGYSIQGNGLVGANVAVAMEKAFLNMRGSLAERLMAALIAGDLAGGQRTGREFAALLVKTPDGWPIDIDLRVDHSSDPVGELKELFDMQMGRQQVIQANVLVRKGQFEEAKAALLQAVARGSGWSRVWLRGAKVAIEIEEPTLALQYLSVAFSQNPAWIKSEIGDGDFADLGANPQFHRWISPEQEQQVLADYERVRQAQDVAIDRRIEVSKMLLEIGRADQALNVLDTTPESAAESTDLGLLRSAAYAAKGNYSKAIEQCKSILQKTPNQERVRQRIARFEEEAAVR
jgi:uncharacterized Ntn-hydrolase superfamily protein